MGLEGPGERGLRWDVNQELERLPEDLGTSQVGPPGFPHPKHHPREPVPSSVMLYCKPVGFCLWFAGGQGVISQVSPDPSCLKLSGVSADFRVTGWSSGLSSKTEELRGFEQVT